jgi:hypothetical protein
MEAAGLGADKGFESLRIPSVGRARSVSASMGRRSPSGRDTMSLPCPFYIIKTELAGILSQLADEGIVSRWSSLSRSGGSNQSTTSPLALKLGTPGCSWRRAQPGGVPTSSSTALSAVHAAPFPVFLWPPSMMLMLEFGKREGRAARPAPDSLNGTPQGLTVWFCREGGPAWVSRKVGRIWVGWLRLLEGSFPRLQVPGSGLG